MAQSNRVARNVRNGGGVYKGSGEGGPVKGLPVSVKQGANIPGQKGLKGGTSVGTGTGAGSGEGGSGQRSARPQAPATRHGCGALHPTRQLAPFTRIAGDRSTRCVPSNARPVVIRPPTEARYSAMTIKISKETQKELVASIRRYFAENMEDEIGDLKASLLLDFALQEIGPSVYNLAIADAQTYLQDKVLDIENACWEEEFTYWKPSRS